jgi:hypothetical protein
VREKHSKSRTAGPVCQFVINGMWWGVFYILFYPPLTSNATCSSIVFFLNQLRQREPAINVSFSTFLNNSETYGTVQTFFLQIFVSTELSVHSSFNLEDVKKEQYFVISCESESGSFFLLKGQSHEKVCEIMT